MDGTKDMEIKEEKAVVENKPETYTPETPVAELVTPTLDPKKKEKKKKGKAGLVVALALGCTLTGAAIGIGGTLAFIGMRNPGRMRMNAVKREARLDQDDRSDYGKGRFDGNSGNQQRKNGNNGKNYSKDNRDNSGNPGQGRSGNGTRGQGTPNLNKRSNNGTNNGNGNQSQGNQTPDGQAANGQAPNNQTPDPNGQSGTTGGTNA